MNSSDTQLFCCSVCNFLIPFDTKGRKSKFLSSDVHILEDVYIMRDPFADDNLGGIIIGADCLICKKMVCVSPACSTFLKERYCRFCYAKHQKSSRHSFEVVCLFARFYTNLF
ncbi:hypothetical protein FBUS_07182 [Fasciolopsis buskii]|uniref:Cysteine-rich DPF motif domain-containing protein 1 n=1 Tax=Fasciolopsis buskii TaxID=27845 RepID=A0A8E0VIP4_9TREM|nr:hypothetical protein FBUS_07182 [Fasciolopsis buski]